MKNQKELKEKYMNIIKTEVWQNDEHMQEYARKECEYVVELSNGNIIDIEKPRIEKNFNGHKLYNGGGGVKFV